MMDALISGSAARAVFIQGATVRFIEADDPKNIRQATLSAVPHLLEGATDVVRLRVKDYSDSYPILLSNWQKDRALRMLQVVLSPYDDDELLEAAEYLDDLLANTEIASQLANVLYALPNSGATEFAGLQAIETYHRAHAIVRQLIDDQSLIKAVRDAFEKVRFESPDQKRDFEDRALNSGVFPQIVAAVAGRISSSDAVFTCLKAFSGLPNARTIVQFWTSSLLERSSRKSFKKLDDFSIEYDEIDEPSDLDPRARRAIFERVTAQKAAIVKKLKERDYQTARRFADQLIESQLQTGTDADEYAAKSLSSLATEARRMGLHDIELEWAARAVQVKPEDPWARALLADTYLSLYRFKEAQEEFRTAVVFGEDGFGTIGIARVLRASGQLDNALTEFSSARSSLAGTDIRVSAWLGFCETLRDMWRLEEALSAFEEAHRLFPDERGFALGRAAVLKDFGELAEAADAYSEAIRIWPEEPVAYCGRADALKRKGDFGQAITLYEDAVRLFPNTAFAHTGLADVYRTKGDLDEAQRLYSEAKIKFPFEASAFNGYADTVRDSGNYPLAVAAYNEAIERFPLEPRARNGYANALKLSRDYANALQAFDGNIKDFPYDLYSLSGRANLLKLLGHYDEAVAAYDLIIERRPEFLSALASKASILIAMGQLSDAKALLLEKPPHSEYEWLFYHVKGMFELKSGNVSRAIDIFRDGLQRSPYYRLKDSFRSALALAEIKAKQFSEAVNLLQGAVDPLQRILLSISYAMGGMRADARSTIEAVNDNIAPKLQEIRIGVLRLVERDTVPADEWLIAASEEAVLQAAA